MSDQPARICVSDKYFCSHQGGCPAILEFRAFPPTKRNLRLYAKNCCKHRLEVVNKEEHNE